MLRIIARGLTTGLLLQVSLGPVFFFVIDITIQHSLPDALLAVIAVTIADFLYIALAILGAGRLLEKKKINRILRIVSPLVLIIFGVFIMTDIQEYSTTHSITTRSDTTYYSSFFSALLLTLSSPLTIVFWTSFFSLNAMKYNFSRKELNIFGFSAGTATILFLGTTVFVCSSLKTTIPQHILYFAPFLVGLIVIIYGIILLYKMNSGKKGSLFQTTFF